MSHLRRPVVGVMGGSDASAETARLAHELGAAIAAAGWVLLNGGRDQGVMAASAAGAHEVGGFVVGVLPGRRGEDAEAAGLDLAIYSGVGYARNSINILSSDVVIALPGSNGTLSEVAYAQTYQVPTILLGFEDNGLFGDHVQRAADVADAIARTARILAQA